MKIDEKRDKTRELTAFLTSGKTGRTFDAHERDMPKISIITATYNQAEFIERTICSVLNQGYPSVEHIVIDGGSTDGTLSVLEKYDKDISYWVSETDEGQTHAINKGLERATGDLIGFQNSDDIYLPGAFWRVAEAAKKNPKAGLIYGDFLHIDDKDNVLDEQLLGAATFWVQVMLGPQVHNQAAFWRRSVSERLGLLDQTFVFDMDYEYFSRILYAGYRAVHVSEFLGAFRHHSAAKTSNLGDVSKKELQQVADYYHQKARLLSYVPRKIGAPIAKSVKAGKHILNGRYDYLFRDRIKFK